MTTMTATATPALVGLSTAAVLRSAAVATAAMLIGLLVGAVVLLLSSVAFGYDRYLRARRG